MSESTNELPRIKLALGSLPNCRVFRNNTGMGWIGDRSKPRPIRFGLFPGSGDLLGWVSYQIRPEDVGKTVAVFTSVEVKTPKGRAKPNQLQWQRQVIAAGGIGMVTSNPHEAVNIIHEWRP